MNPKGSIFVLILWVIACWCRRTPPRRLCLV